WAYDSGMRRVTLLLAAVGCAAGVRPEPPLPHPPEVAVLCSPGSAPVVATLALPALAIHAVPWGPRGGEQPPDVLTPRAGPVLRLHDLAACYRWARASDPSLAPTLTARFAIDELGRVDGALDEVPAGAETLAGCVRDLIAAAPAQPFSSAARQI